MLGVANLLTNKNTKRAVNRRASQKKSPEKQHTPLIHNPMKFVRSVEGQYDIVCDGINPSVGSINFSLNDLPNFAEFTSLFSMYKVEEVEIEWYPEYTELSDAALVSNAVNEQFNTAIDHLGYTITAVNDVLQYRTLHSTGITKPHKRRFVPAYLMDTLSPVSCYLSCQSASTNLYGIAFGIPPTGVPMTFRSRCRFYLSFAQPRWGVKPGWCLMERDIKLPVMLRKGIGRQPLVTLCCQHWTR